MPHAARHAPPDAAHLAASGRALRLLVVEDDCLVGLGLEYLLKAMGHEVCGVAVLADQAVAMAAEVRPDLVLMDVDLGPARDGVDAALEIRSRLGIPCLMTTANDDSATRARAEPAGPLGWVPKPYSRAALERALGRALAGPLPNHAAQAAVDHRLRGSEDGVAVAAS